MSSYSNSAQQTKAIRQTVKQASKDGLSYSQVLSALIRKAPMRHIMLYPELKCSESWEEFVSHVQNDGGHK